MEIVLRSIKNVLRNPIRLALMVTLLGASLMFVAAMTSLSTNSQQELATIHQLVGTTITVNYATNDAGQHGASGGGGNGAPGFFGGGTKPIPDSVVANIKRIPGVASMQESLSRPDTDGLLQGGKITAPTGQEMDAPLTVNGISPDASTFTLMGGVTP